VQHTTPRVEFCVLPECYQKVALLLALLITSCLYFLALLQCFIVLCHFYMPLILRINFTIFCIPL